jgi:acetylornithine deacetylase/succinyl-diaminopimelate desuccinylase-like protein
MKNPDQYLKEHFSEYLEDLKTLVRIPSVSFSGFPASEVKRAADAVAALLKKRGLENVELLDIPGAEGKVNPYVYGDWLHAPGAPTLLLYAHYDVQPPGREEIWKTPPFEPILKEGPGGERLYARGSADDKAGIVVHTSAIDACLKTLGQLPVNVKVVIEGEEEIGSTHLPLFLKAYKDRLSADVMVLTDSGNFDCGIPALTVALRGLVEMEVEVRALTKTVHSGMWGGPVPDPAIALTKMLSGLVDQDGRIAVPGILDQVRPISEAEEAELKKIPYSEEDFRKQVGMVSGAQLLTQGPSAAVQVWRLPSLTVNAIQASSRKQAGNIINDVAWAKVTIRLVPDMDPKDVTKKLEQYLRAQVPWGLELHLKNDACNGPWAQEMSPRAVTVYAAAESALNRGYGQPPYKIGCGGSIPFVKPFAEALGGAPALLIGVEDPYTDAHGENESLLVSDLLKSSVSQVYLFSEVAAKLKNESE